MDLYNRITTFIDRWHLVPPDSTIIIGLSGGSDSVFLLHYLLLLQTIRPFALIAAHMNHEWRAEADHDEQFCRELATQHGIPCFIGRASVYRSRVPHTGSKEELGRLMRRMMFQEILGSLSGQTRIALAHHQDDQDETFFIRLVRGAGIQGLKGMTAYAAPYIRPLLCVRKHELLKYLDDYQLSYVIDSTNHDDSYLRNRIRHRVLPALRHCDHRFSHSLHQALNHLADADEFLTTLAENSLVSISTCTAGVLWLNIPQFLTQHHFFQKYLLMHWLKKSDVSFTPSQGFLNEIVRFLQHSGNGTHILSPSWHIQKQSQKAAIIPR